MDTGSAPPTQRGSAAPSAASSPTASATTAHAPRASQSASGSADVSVAGRTNTGSIDSAAGTPRWAVGICCMDSKARSRPMRNILNRLMQTGDFECVVFGDKVILDEEVESWPSCDFLISLFSAGFPLHKAIRYVKLRKPFLVNDLETQEMLWDRRLVLYLLDSVGVPTPRRLSSYTGDEPDLSPSLADKFRELNLPLPVFPKHPVKARLIDYDTLQIGDKIMRKPFVEKPISGEDHNIYIYYPKSQGGGVRKLFRKIGNKSSEFYPELSDIRQGAYIYEEFMNVNNAEDVKVYTLGSRWCHAETRKSPVVDGVVRRNAEGKEIRYVTELSENEVEIAKLVSKAFRQTICGFDLLRAEGKSYVIDVNGWSFVKGNSDYYDKCATVLREMFLESLANNPPPLRRDLSIENQWRLKGFLSVMRHGDRTPKQKCKFTFELPGFMNLLNGGSEEVLLKGEDQLNVLMRTCADAIDGGEQSDKLLQLLNILKAKSHLPGTKAQVKPIFTDTNVLSKVQLVLKWGGEFTHGGLHQTKDFAENLRKDLLIINKSILEDVTVYSSSERRVIATAEIFFKTLLATEASVEDRIVVNKEMLDDSNAAKKQIESVKDNFQKMLDPTHSMSLPKYLNSVVQVEPMEAIETIILILQGLRTSMYSRSKQEEVAAASLLMATSPRSASSPRSPTSTTKKWCSGDNWELFFERWCRIFKDFCDVDRSNFEPSKISELYDSLKFDLLHNKEVLESCFIGAENICLDDLAALYYNAKAMFKIVATNEYGLTKEEKLEIGALSSQYLMRQLLADLKSTRDSDCPKAFFYFTKESKVISLMNIVLCSGLATKISEIDELDYLTQIVFELYERIPGLASVIDSPCDSNDKKDKKEYSLRLSFSQGAHATDLIAIHLDAKHSISVQPRRWASDHISLVDAMSNLEDCLKVIQQ